MDLLVLGGSGWLGAEVARQALLRGHAVTCLTRGRSGEAPDGVRAVRADRDLPAAYAALAGAEWDAVIDVARQPGHVRRGVAALHETASTYVFVSTVSVYGPDGDLLPALETDAMTSMEEYGEAKVACEEAVLAGFGPERSLIARAGLIGGPGDTSGRSGYWPWRFARPADASGAVLVPDDPAVPVALIDVRDLAAWLVTCAERATSGVVDALGDHLPLADHLDLAREVAGHSGPVLAAPPAWLAEQGVQNWMGPTSLPLWLSDPVDYAMADRDNSAAKTAGLTLRPLDETLADTLAWEVARPEPGPHGAGLGDDEERRLLALLRASAVAGAP